MASHAREHSVKFVASLEILESWNEKERNNQIHLRWHVYTICFKVIADK